MILEEIDGEVKVVLNGKALTVGSSIEDSQWPLVGVIGKGKATFRVDPSCTVEVKGVETDTSTIKTAPVAEKAPIAEKAPVAEIVVDTTDEKA